MRVPMHTLSGVRVPSWLLTTAGHVTPRYGVNMVSESPAHVHLTGLSEDGRVSRICRRYCDGFEECVPLSSTRT